MMYVYWYIPFYILVSQFLDLSRCPHYLSHSFSCSYTDLKIVTKNCNSSIVSDSKIHSLTITFCIYSLLPLGPRLQQSSHIKLCEYRNGLGRELDLTRVGEWSD